MKRRQRPRTLRAQVAPVVHTVALHPSARGFHHVHRTCKRPHLNLRITQGRKQTRIMDAALFLPHTHAQTGFDLHSKAAAPTCGLKPQHRQTQAVLLGQGSEFGRRRMRRCKQPIQRRCNAEVDRLAVHHLGHEAHGRLHQADRTQAANAAQPLVEQRVVGFDHARLQQQSTHLTRGFDEVDAARLRHHAGLVGCAQVAHDAAANVHTFADVQRQRAVAAKNVHTRAAWQRSQTVGVNLVGQHSLWMLWVTTPHTTKSSSSLMRRGS